MTDQEILTSLGGPAKVAELLGYDKTSGGVQRVHNWMTRGIPAQVKLDHPELFLNLRARRIKERRATERRTKDRRFSDKKS